MLYLRSSHHVILLGHQKYWLAYWWQISVLFWPWKPYCPDTAVTPFPLNPLGFSTSYLYWMLFFLFSCNPHSQDYTNWVFPAVTYDWAGSTDFSWLYGNLKIAESRILVLMEGQRGEWYMSTHHQPHHCLLLVAAQLSLTLFTETMIMSPDAGHLPACPSVLALPLLPSSSSCTASAEINGTCPV